MSSDPFSVFRTSGAHIPRVYLARSVAFTGFLNLLTPYFSKRLPALFHAGNALGVHLSELSPSAVPLSLSTPAAFLLSIPFTEPQLQGLHHSKDAL